MADRQNDINRYKAFEQQWHVEDKEFLAYTGNIIEKKKLTGNQIVPLLKTVKVNSSQHRNTIKYMFIKIILIFRVTLKQTI